MSSKIIDRYLRKSCTITSIIKVLYQSKQKVKVKVCTKRSKDIFRP